MSLNVVEDACAASSAAAHATALKALETRGIAVVKSSGPEVVCIPDAPSDLGVDLPVPRPPEDETYAAAAARLDASVGLVADRVEGTESRPPPLVVPAAAAGAVGTGLLSPDSFSLDFPIETPAAEEVDHFALEGPASGPLSAAPPSMISRAHSDNPTRTTHLGMAVEDPGDGQRNLLLRALPRLHRAKSDASGVVASPLHAAPDTPRVPSAAPLSPGFFRGRSVGGQQASAQAP